MCNIPRDYTIRNGTAAYLRGWLNAMDAISEPPRAFGSGTSWVYHPFDDIKLIEFNTSVAAPVPPFRPQPDMNFDNQTLLFNDGEYVGYFW